MKSYTITVNGNVYDVTVEEKGASVAAPVRTASASAAPAPAPAQKTSAPTGAQGAVKVTSPFPGKVLQLKAEAGAQVSKGTVLMVVEAMKMENDIVAPEDGTVATINVAAGDAVEAGDVLATLN